MCDLETQFGGLETKGINFDEFKLTEVHYIHSASTGISCLNAVFDM